MKRVISIIISFSILIFLAISTFGGTTSLQNIFRNVDQAERTLEIDHECHYPFNPSSIRSLFILFEDGIRYITSGEKRCAWHFVKELEASVRNTIFLPSYFQEKFLKNIEKEKNDLIIPSYFIG